MPAAFSGSVCTPLGRQAVKQARAAMAREMFFMGPSYCLRRGLRSTPSTSGMADRCSHQSGGVTIACGVARPPQHSSVIALGLEARHLKYSFTPYFLQRGL